MERKHKQGLVYYRFENGDWQPENDELKKAWRRIQCRVNNRNYRARRQARMRQLRNDTNQPPKSPPRPPPPPEVELPFVPSSYDSEKIQEEQVLFDDMQTMTLEELRPAATSSDDEELTAAVAMACQEAYDSPAAAKHADEGADRQVGQEGAKPRATPRKVHHEAAQVAGTDSVATQSAEPPALAETNKDESQQLALQVVITGTQTTARLSCSISHRGRRTKSSAAAIMAAAAASWRIEMARLQRLEEEQRRLIASVDTSEIDTSPTRVSRSTQT